MNSVPSIKSGALYVVATPIGNLADLSERAKQVLAAVDLIACEDTRHSQRLLQHLGIKAQLVSVHDHNERQRMQWLADKLAAGTSVALVSDAGTPLISDPGYHLVHGLREQGHEVIPIPGPSALIAALSVAGLATDRFYFAGFLPHKAGPKQERLAELKNDTATLVFYESKHRIIETLQLMTDCFGGERTACVARELTKTFEQFFNGSLSDILALIESDNDHQKGEFVVMVAGNPAPESANEFELEQLLDLLTAELPPKKVAHIAAQLSGGNKKEIYNQLLARQGKK